LLSRSVDFRKSTCHEYIKSLTYLFQFLSFHNFALFRSPFSLRKQVGLSKSYAKAPSLPNSSLDLCIEFEHNWSSYLGMCVRLFFVRLPMPTKWLISRCLQSEKSCPFPLEFGDIKFDISSSEPENRKLARPSTCPVAWRQITRL